MNSKSVREQVSSLINTSVQDMQSGLWNYNDLDVLRAALDAVNRRGEKTKARILASKISKLEKDDDLPGVCSLGYDMTERGG